MQGWCRYMPLIMRLHSRAISCQRLSKVRNNDQLLITRYPRSIDAETIEPQEGQASPLRT